MHSIDINLNALLNPIIDGINGVVPKVPAALLQTIVGVLLIQVAARLLRIVLALTGVQKSFRQVVSSVTMSVMYVLLFILILQTLGLSGVITFFTGSVLAIGLVMAAGGSTLVSDIFAGLFLARDADFNVGDEITAGEGPTTGVVISLDSRRVRLRDEDGRVHVIPNSIVERKEWTVEKRHAASSGISSMVVGAKKLTAAAAMKAAAVVDKTNSGDKS